MLKTKIWSPYTAGLGLMAGFLVYAVISQMLYAARAPFHFDELNEMSRIFTADTGRVMSALRSGFHYLFIPVSWLELSEEQLLILLRQLNFGLFVVPSLILSGLIVYHIRRSYFLALLAPALAMATDTYYSVVHQYRTDQFSVFVFLFLLWLFLRSDLDKKKFPFYIGSGFLMGLCFFHNPKSVYFFIALCTFIVLRENWSQGLGDGIKKLVPKGIQFGLFTALFFIGLTILHMHHYDLGFDQLNRQAERAAQTGLGHIAQGGGTSSYVREFYQNNLLLFNALLVIMGTAAWQAVKSIRIGSSLHSADIIVLTTFVVLSTFYIHRGVYSYYAIIFMLIVTISIAIGSDAIWRSLDRPVAAGLIIICAFSFIQMYDALEQKGRQKLQFQKAMIRSLNDVFPQVKTYADGANLMARKHNVLNLFTAKKRTLYMAGQLQNFRDVYKKTPPELIVHTSKFAVHDYNQKDFIYLRNNFARISEYLWLPGRRFHNPIQGIAQKHWFRLSGTYRLETTNPNTKVLIDGQEFNPSVNLQKGAHQVVCTQSCEAFKIYRSERDMFNGDLVLKVFPGEKKTIQLSRKKYYRLVNFRDPAAVRAAEQLLVNGAKAARREGRQVYMRVKKGKVIIENKSKSTLLFDIFVRPISSA